MPQSLTSPLFEPRCGQAWAYKGLGSVHEKEGNLDAALGAYDQAAQVWRRLQSKGESSLEHMLINSVCS